MRCSATGAALGALMSYLQTEVFTMEHDGRVVVNKLAPVEGLLNGRCAIDPVSMRALQIFHEEFHPLQTKGKGRSKEGFSVFNICDRTSSRGGRRCLREWFRNPLSDAREISLRQEGIELFVRPE